MSIGILGPWLFYLRIMHQHFLGPRHILALHVVSHSVWNYSASPETARVNAHGSGRQSIARYA